MQISNQILSYANAIFSLTSDKKQLEKYFEQIKTLDSINQSNDDLFNVLSSRSIKKDDKKELIKSILSQLSFEQNIVFWVWTIIDNNMYGSFHTIAKACYDVYYDLFDIQRVRITSANELSKTQIDLIKDFFEKKLNKKVSIEQSVNKKLIGGLSISINNKIYNNTLKNKLESLKKELLFKKG